MYKLCKPSKVLILLLNYKLQASLKPFYLPECICGNVYVGGEISGFLNILTHTIELLMLQQLLVAYCPGCVLAVVW